MTEIYPRVIMFLDDRETLNNEDNMSKIADLIQLQKEMIQLQKEIDDLNIKRKMIKEAFSVQDDWPAPKARKAYKTRGNKI